MFPYPKVVFRSYYTSPLTSPLLKRLPPNAGEILSSWALGTVLGGKALYIEPTSLWELEARQPLPLKQWE